MRSPNSRRRADALGSVDFKFHHLRRTHAALLRIEQGKSGKDRFAMLSLDRAAAAAADRAATDRATTARRSR